MLGLPRKVEKLWKNRAKPAASAPLSAIKTSATGLSPKSHSCNESSVATTSWDRRSYSASSPIKVRIRGTSSADASLTSFTLGKFLRLRVGAYERLGDLDGVGRRTLEQVVRDAPVLHDPPRDPHPPHVNSRIPGVLQRGRESVRITGEGDARRVGKCFAHFLQRDIPFELDVDALGMAGVHGDADRGRVDFEVGEDHDLARLPDHLGLLGGPPVLPDRPDQGNGVTVDGLGIDVLTPVLERIHPAAS